MEKVEKLSNFERAKQFLPYEPVDGLEKVLKLKEFEIVMLNKKIMLEDKVHKIFSILGNIEQYEKITVSYFCDGELKTVSGKPSIDYDFGAIKIANETIDFFVIFEIEETMICFNG